MTTAFGKDIDAHLEANYPEFALILTLSPNTPPARIIAPAILKKLSMVVCDVLTTEFGVVGELVEKGAVPPLPKQ